MNQYQVCWQSLLNAAQGRSEPMPRYLAEFLAKYRETSEPDMKLWVEECPPTLH